MVFHIIFAKLQEFSVQNVLLCSIAFYYSKIQPHSPYFFTASPASAGSFCSFSSLCRKDYFSPMQSLTLTDFTDFTDHLRCMGTTSNLLRVFPRNARSLRASIAIYLSVFPASYTPSSREHVYIKNTILSLVSFLWLLPHSSITHFQVCDLNQLFKFQKSQLRFLCRGDNESIYPIHRIKK